jgi:GMP synthase (glutamine-hydrolysing)
VSGDGDHSQVVLVVQHEDDAGPGALSDALLAAGLRADVWHAGGARPLPHELGSYAGLAVLGGRMSANDAAVVPYLEAVKGLFAQAAAGGLPALGICLGAQLAAAALGGRVTRRARGPRIGWLAAAGNPADPLTAALERRARLFCWHGDSYTAPPGATPLLGHWDAFRLGSVAAFQSHPEVTPAIIADWCRTATGADELARAGTSAAAVLDDAAVDLRSGPGILARWCSEVRSRSAVS